MKKIFKTAFFGGFVMLALVGITFSSCSKTKNETSTATPEPTYPTPSDGDVVLVAVNATSPFGMSVPSVPGMPIDEDDLMMDMGMGFAIMKDNGKADKVVLNDKELKYTNGTYSWMPDAKSIVDPNESYGIDLSGEIVWEVTNPNINKTFSGGLPGKPKITSDKSVNLSAGYTFENNLASSAQKIIYAIYSEKGEKVLIEKDGSSTSCEFTAQDLSALSKSKYGIIQANAYIIDSETIGGQKIYYVRQSSYSINNVPLN